MTARRTRAPAVETDSVVTEEAIESWLAEHAREYPLALQAFRWEWMHQRQRARSEATVQPAPPSEPTGNVPSYLGRHISQEELNRRQREEGPVVV